MPSSPSRQQVQLVPNHPARILGIRSTAAALWYVTNSSQPCTSLPAIEQCCCSRHARKLPSDLCLEGFAAARFELQDLVVYQRLSLRLLKLHVVVSHICFVLVTRVVLFAYHGLHHVWATSRHWCWNSICRGKKSAIVQSSRLLKATEPLTTQMGEHTTVTDLAWGNPRKILITIAIQQLMPF